MTLTTGVAPVAPAADAAVEALRHDLVRPRTARRRIAWLVVTLDLLAAALASVLTVVLAPSWGLPMTALAVVAWPLAVALAGGYGRLGQDPYDIPLRMLLAAGAVFALLGWVVLALAPGDAAGVDPRSLAVSSLLLAGSAPVVTIALRALLPAMAPRRPSSLVLVGASEDVRALLKEADRGSGRRSFEPVAVCLTDLSCESDLDPVAEPWPVPVWYGEDQLLHLVHLHDPEGVLAVPGPGIGHAELRRWGAWLQDVDLFVSPGLRDVAPERLGLATLGGTRLLRVRPAALSGPAQLAKGIFDRIAAAVLLILLAPVLGVLAVLIRRDSPGPAVYRQSRVGRHGKLFTVYKLRTMRVDADRVVEELAHHNESDREGVLFKIKRDPRITRPGSWLRTYSLDELPQLLNVVRGEMSLVGPRPALPSEVAAYDPDLRRRLDVKPGMTGLWQVSGRSDLPWEETVRLDLQYVDNWSWRLDAGIVVRTATAVLSHRGAY
jgi:exopolysaccharide biosynthesis polyprenyl glycosylphosphotransferase